MMVCSITSLRVMLNWRCSTSAWAVMAGFCLPGRCVSRLRARAMRRWFTRTLRDRPGRIPLHSNCALAMPGKSAIQTGGGLWLNLSERAFWQPLELARPNAFFDAARHWLDTANPGAPGPFRLAVQSLYQINGGYHLGHGKEWGKLPPRGGAALRA